MGLMRGLIAGIIELPRKALGKAPKFDTSSTGFKLS